MPGRSLEERTVEVEVPGGGLDEELLALYFENSRRSGGGLLESLERREGGVTLVFEDAAAAARVVSRRRHLLQNLELKVRQPPVKDPRRLLLRGVSPTTSVEMVEMYVENVLGLNGSDYALYPGGDGVLIRLSQPLSEDFQALSTKISRRLLDRVQIRLEQVDRTDAVLVENLPAGATAELVTLYFESERGGSHGVKEAVMLSEGTATVSFLDSESVDAVVDRPHTLNHAEVVVKVHADPRPSQQTPAAAETDAATAPGLAAGPRAAPAVPPDRCSSQTGPGPGPGPASVWEGPTEAHIDVPDPGRRALLRSSSFLRDALAAHPDVSVQLTDGGALLAGPDPRRVERLKQKMLDFTGSMAETRYPVDEDRAEFLRREDVRTRLLEALYRAGAVYAVAGRDVIVTSRDSAGPAWDVLTSLVSSFSVAVEEQHRGLLDCREWSEFVEALGLTAVQVSEQEGGVRVLTLASMEAEKRAAIVDFLTTPIQRETAISMQPGVLKYIQIHHHQLLADMEPVSIFPLEGADGTGLKIHGHAVACQTAEEVLKDVVSSICTRTITVSAPGVTRFLDVEDCRSILKEMETKFKVYICIKCVPWQPAAHQDVFKGAWQLMSQKNFQKVSMDGSGQQDPNRGLLEEARRIVSAIDERQPEADHLEDVGELDLYTAEEPSGRTDGESDGMVVGASRPSTNQNGSGASVLTAAGSGLHSSLEEEAQLSLAIQYSMESSQWSLKEEEQLQEVLELSKKTLQHQHCPGVTAGSRQQQGDVAAALQAETRAANTVQLEVFAGYSCDLLRVDIAFNKKVNQRQVEETVELRGVRNISEYHRNCLDLIKRKHGVEVGLQGATISVSGFKDFVPGAVCDVKLLLEKVSNSVLDQEILRCVQWLRHHPASSDGVAYSPEATVFIENAWRMKLERVHVTFDLQPHVLDFEKMEEHHVASGRSVKISRRLSELGDLTPEIPEAEYSLLSNLPEATRIQEDADEFQDVVKTFYQTIHEYHNKIRIVQVEKLMNRLLYHQYKLKKASVLQQSSHPAVERTLYHGTSEASVKEICVHGFNRSFCGKNATLYGQGVYFAVNSALSVQDQYSPPNADGYKFVLVSKVLTGDFTKGCHAMKTAPLKETGEIPLRYDSVTDDITNPTMFVIFNDTQAFPEYLITCQRVHR